ncbi:hypothetical protein ACRYCC_06930 [Actinomadura scrupuli]|uniref:hypothetical protein n=1 Tax=Actinomadura scrupuli TaxID=559629 RepID=UPI003D96C345
MSTMYSFWGGTTGDRMRDGLRRRRGIAVLVAVAGMTTPAVSACGSGGNTSAICRDAEKAFGDFSARLKTISPTEAAQWQRASADLATRLDGLAKSSDDARLKRTLTDMAGSWRSFGGTVTTKGETTQLSAMLAAQPQRLAAACG